jgi:hypothetical protein
MSGKLSDFIENNPWIYLVVASWLSVEVANCLREYRALTLIRQATEITKDAADV